MMPYLFAVEGLDPIGEFDEVPEAINIAAVRALNKTSLRARAEAGRGIRRQLALPARYVSGQDSRLRVTKKATGGDLETIVGAEQRATSLARFAGGRQRKRGVRVTVKPGVARYLKSAFLMPLRRGAAGTGNVGLAVRTDGTKPSGAYKPKQLRNNLWLLYGPSVDQAFATVREDIADDTADFLEYEFNRLLDLGGLD